MKFKDLIKKYGRPISLHLGRKSGEEYLLFNLRDDQKNRFSISVWTQAGDFFKFAGSHLAEETENLQKDVEIELPKGKPVFLTDIAVSSAFRGEGGICLA